MGQVPQKSDIPNEFIIVFILFYRDNTIILAHSTTQLQKAADR